MPDEIRTKDQLIALMADNSTGDITPQDMRDFVVSNNVQEIQQDTSPAVLDSHSDVFLAQAGCNALTLTTLADYGERNLQIFNNSGGDLVITPDGAETIGGEASTTLADKSYLLLGGDAGTEWLVLVRTDNNPPPPDYCLAYFNESVAVTTILVGTYVDINEFLLEGTKTDAFSISSDEITYNGDDKNFSVDVSASVEKQGGGDQDYTFAVAINDVIQVPTMGRTFKNKAASIPLQSIVSLTDGDVLNVQVRGDTTSDDVIVYDLTIRLTEI